MRYGDAVHDLGISGNTGRCLHTRPLRRVLNVRSLVHVRPRRRHQAHGAPLTFRVSSGLNCICRLIKTRYARGMPNWPLNLDYC
jgi:hypothetical protein